MGVDGADITVTSDGGALLTTAGDELHLAGNVTFTNVRVSAKTIYAEGHKLVLDEGLRRRRGRPAAHDSLRRQR